jgi:hypothetical protein
MQGEVHWFPVVVVLLGLVALVGVVWGADFLYRRFHPRRVTLRCPETHSPAVCILRFDNVFGRYTGVEHEGRRPADVLCRAAADHGADLLVVGSHGRTGLERLLLGSVAERVIRHAPCPVLCVRARPAPVAERP